MSKFHVSKKKEKKRKSALKIIYMYPGMIVSKKKQSVFNWRVDFITISWMHATYSLVSLGSLHNNKGESRENVT